MRTRIAGDFLLRMSRYDPGIAVPMHWHSVPYFCFVIRGGIDERCDGDPRHFGAGSIHFHPAAEPHGGRMGSEGLLSLSIVPLGAVSDRLGRQPVRRREAETPRMAALAGRCLDAFRDRDPTSELLVESRALELVASLLCPSEVPIGGTLPRWLAGVRDHLHVAFGERLTIRDLAAEAQVHEVHLVRAFRRHFGVPPATYLRRVRIEAARLALLSTEQPIAAIALDVGFSSQAHLTRAFSAAWGLPPAAYRRQHGTARTGRAR